MTRTLIKSFSAWGKPMYRVETEDKNTPGRMRAYPFYTQEAAFLFAEEQVRAGRNARVYKLEED